MNQKMTGKRSLALMLCAVLACVLMCNPTLVWASVAEQAADTVVEEVDDATEDADDEPTVDNSEQIADLQNQLNQISQDLEQYQQEQDRIQAEINSAQSDKAEAEAVRDQYGAQITLTEQEISTLQQRITLLRQDITQKEKQIAEKRAAIEEKQKEIDEKQTEIDDNYAIFKERLRAQYMQDTGSVLGLLLGADSFSGFLSHAETVNRIAQHDRELMQKLTEEREELEKVQSEMQDAAAELEAAMTQLESSKTLLEEDKVQVEAKNEQLSVQYAQADADVQDLAKMEAEFMADLTANKAKQQQMQNEINSLYQQIEFTQNPYVGGAMAWPLPGFSTISSAYGWRFGGSDFHTGMDITGSGCYGANIVAANDGVVSFVNTTYTQGVGYGIYVIIDHGMEDGDSISTLYAHCSAIHVSVGQTVKRGQTIASVGSTGWSTGPHLHFEVRINGSHVNPAGYVS